MCVHQGADRSIPPQKVHRAHAGAQPRITGPTRCAAMFFKLLQHEIVEVCGLLCLSTDAS